MRFLKKHGWTIFYIGALANSAFGVILSILTHDELSLILARCTTFVLTLCLVWAWSTYDSNQRTITNLMATNRDLLTYKELAYKLAFTGALENITIHQDTEGVYRLVRREEQKAERR